MWGYRWGHEANFQKRYPQILMQVRRGKPGSSIDRMIEATEHEAVTAGSERRFAGVFAIVAFWPLLHGRGLRWWAVTIRQ